MVDLMKKTLYHDVDDILLPLHFSASRFKEALTYRAKSDDVFVVSYPKSGTTWLHYITFLIFQKGKAAESKKHFNTVAPFIDTMGNEGIKNMYRPGPIKTHLPYDRLPFCTDAKYIFVARNPWDVCVSMYHHTVAKSIYDFSELKFEDYFELFMNGEVYYGDYFDHLLSWYPHRQDKNVFYTTYEMMHKDRRSVILKVAEFLGKEYLNSVEHDNSVFNNILHLTTLESMKDLFNVTFSLPDTDGIKEDSSKLEKINSGTTPKKPAVFNLVRKGVVGDWTNYFDEEQLEKLKIKFHEKAKGTGIEDLWPNLENIYTKTALVPQ